jgi:glycine rich protein
MKRFAKLTQPLVLPVLLVGALVTLVVVAAEHSGSGRPETVVAGSGATNSTPAHGIREYLASGSFVGPTNASSVTVEAWGAGGGGGYAANGPYFCTGGSGGNGGYVRTVVAVAAGASIPITVGHGGVAGTGPGVATAGGNTTFGTKVTAGGGGPGGDNSNSSSCQNTIPSNGVAGTAIAKASASILVPGGAANVAPQGSGAAMINPRIGNGGNGANTLTGEDPPGAGAQGDLIIQW